MIGWFITLLIAAVAVSLIFHVGATAAWIIVLVALGVGFVLRSKAPNRRITRTGAVFKSVCPYCGKHTKPAAVVCSHCGNALVTKR
jgi:hypothetical protein